MSLNIEVEYWINEESVLPDIEKQTVGNCRLTFKNNIMQVNQYGKLIFLIDIENNIIETYVKPSKETHKIHKYSIW